MTKEEIAEKIREAKELGAAAVTIEGITYGLVQPIIVETFQKKKASGPVPDMKHEELIAPLPIFEDYTDEEMLFWSTPEFDRLISARKAKEEVLKEERALRHG